MVTPPGSTRSGDETPISRSSSASSLDSKPTKRPVDTKPAISPIKSDSIQENIKSLLSQISKPSAVTNAISFKDGLGEQL